MSNDQGDRSGPPANKVDHLNLTRAGIVVLIFVIAVFAGLSWSSVTKESPGAAPATTTTVVPTTVPPTTVARANVKVQVANGTTTAGVATRVTQTLQTQGWNTLPPVNTSAPATTSTVYYAASQKLAALDIAKELGLTPASVVPLTASVPVAGAAGDEIVVVVGPNLATG